MRIMLALCLLAICGAIGCWDVYCMATGQSRETVSSIMQDWTRQHPMLGIAIGVIIGHVFWPVG